MNYSRGQIASAVCVLGLIFTVHIWVLTAGRMTRWPQPAGHYYSLLADAFLHGQLSLRELPPPELLALTDPYDPAANEPFRQRMHDALLYRGRYFIYWGPVPALLTATVKAICGLKLLDSHLVVLFIVGLLLCGGLLIVELWRQYFSDQPWWTVLLALTVFGLANPVPFLLGRPQVYEAAIAASQCFLFAGIYWTLVAFRSRSAGRISLTLAGICWALAVGSRVSLAPAVTVMALLAVYRLYCLRRTDGPTTRLWSPLVSLGAPLVLGAVGLSVYNYLRFNSFLEFGVRYQLAGDNVHAIVDSELYSPRHIIPNLYTYLFSGVSLKPLFPFVHHRWPPSPLPELLMIPNRRVLEPTAGVAITSPFAWMVVVPLLFLVVRRRGLAAESPSNPEQDLPNPLPRWVVACLLAALLGILPGLTMYSCTMRYLADFVPALLVLATVGFWQLGRAFRSVKLIQLLVRSVGIALALVSVSSGVLLGVSSYCENMKSRNPKLYESLQVNMMPPWVSCILGRVDNPNGILPGNAFWMGPTDTTLEIYCKHDGMIRLSAAIHPWGTDPHGPPHRVLIATDRGYSHVQSICSGSNAITLPAQRGKLTLKLRTLDEVTSSPLLNPDPQTRLLGVMGLRIDLK